MSEWTLNIGIWIISLWLPVLQAAENNLYFSGTLVNEPCILAEEDRMIEIDFKSVINKDLYINGRTKGQPIDLHLQNCDLDVGKRTVHISFSGNESSELPGFLELRSTTVQGLLVGLETLAGEPLPLNKSHLMGELTRGENLLSFNTFLQGEPKVLANRTLGQGDFEASLTFALSYE
ncbi:Pilin (type 1 fimbria component protein) [Pseudomonas simiae]|uniref:fimbrial protein n=1 Tax=Pseudomonas simiae TaxID=321846 RepID=UPI00084DFD06|nr:fimbrial protein [Pseudomonas simiae]SFB39395.1 Pilin (type 1 fimbria component protein) [Pseudomonas simiae]